jgi:hypothetical protein
MPTDTARRQARKLHDSWQTACEAVRKDPTGDIQLSDREQSAYDRLVEFVDAHDLTYTSFDPRGEEQS